MADSPMAKVFTSAGAEAGEMALDPTIFGIEPNTDVMHQVVTAQRAAARSGSASTKTRAEVRGGGRKAQGRPSGSHGMSPFSPRDTPKVPPRVLPAHATQFSQAAS